MKIRWLWGWAIWPLTLPAADGCKVLISVPEQTMTVLRGQTRLAQYPISTSKFGLGDGLGSFRTPLGKFRIERKCGGHQPIGTVFKHLQPTGEILRPNAPGRDPIVTRVLCLRGEEARNGNAGARGIYIHGTPEESRIGQPASFGCIRMRSRDVVQFFEQVDVGTQVVISSAGSTPERATSTISLAAQEPSADWFR